MVFEVKEHLFEKGKPRFSWKDSYVLLKITFIATRKPALRLKTAATYEKKVYYLSTCTVPDLILNFKISLALLGGPLHQVARLRLH